MADRVKPIVRLFFACDSAALDLNDDKWVLKNPWHTVAMPPGVTAYFGAEEIWLYAQLAGGVGEFNLSVELYNEAGLRVGRSNPEPREFQGGFLADEVVFHMTQVPFEQPGLYTFKLMANHVEADGGVFELRVLSG